MPTERMKPLHIFVPFTKVERRAEDDALIVEGYAFVNEVVGGENGIRLKRTAMEAATPDYMRFGAVREMHQPIAAGTALQALWDDTGCLLRSECVDPVAKLKIERGVYKGYSVGVNPRVMRGKDVEECEWPETSYVDRPKDPDATFLHRAEGFDPEQDVEVEVLPDVTTLPEGGESPPDTAGAATPPVPTDRESLALPSNSSSTEPTAEVAPPAGDTDTPAGGDSFPEVDRAAMRAALVRSGVPEEMLDQLDVATSYAGLTPEQRAQTTETVPIRENLEGPRTTVPLPKGMPPPPKPGTGYPPPATKPPAIPPGMMPKKRSSVLGDSWTVDDPLTGKPLGEFVRESDAMMFCTLVEPLFCRDANLERVIKHEGDKWCVYSESGRKLGEHDTEEEAKKQLQAIEIEKHKDEEGATQPKGDRAAEAEVVRYEIVEAPGLFGADTTAFVLFDNQKKIVVRMLATREAAEQRLAQLTAPAVEEPPPAAPETVSRSSDREDVTAILSRATTAEAELVRVQAAEQEALTRLAAAEARVQTLERMPAEGKRIIRFPHALTREFLARMGGEEDAALKRLQAEYPDAKRAAEEEAKASGGRGGPAYDRWMQIRSELLQLGASPDTAAPGG